MIDRIIKWFGSVIMGIVCLFYSIFEPKEFMAMWYYIKDKLGNNEYKHGEEVEVRPMTNDLNRKWVKRTYVAYAEEEGQFPHVVKDDYGNSEMYEHDDIRAIK